MDIPSSEAEARDHIAQIRKAKGLDGPESNISDLEAALIILSEQLYQKSTHFLLELIQNADDNTYTTSGPTLNLSYSRRTLRLDCNEVGFGKKNVEAICKIGRSTKIGLANTTRYIGEKGIGFKSVFKVSDVVWITSGHYSFKFDKKETLGMIAPVWEKFPEPPLPGYTSIFLQLSRDYDPDELIAEVKSLDPRLLIFLRKLRQVNLMVLESDRSIWKSTLRRHDLAFGNVEENPMELWHNEECSSLKNITFPVKDLPFDPKRPGSTQSAILLAFPITRNGDPWIDSQKVYAFLPIRDYGFKFLLQADFLLIASREDIDSSSAWNRRLLDAIPHAFLKAVQQFNKGPLRYNWMRYLPNNRTLSGFFEALESAILKLLSEAPILEDISGKFTAPSKLKYVPADYTDITGEPLIFLSQTTYLSRSYSPSDAYALKRVGVKNLEAEDFLADLRFFIINNPHGFRNKSNAWHSRLSNALSRIIHSDEKLKLAVSKLEIVPLRDGRWVCPSQKNICFASHSDILTVPKGIEAHEIHPRVTSDACRKNLLTTFGAITFSKDFVCEAIVVAHESPVPSPDLSISDLISHIVFLYTAKWNNIGQHDLWLVTEYGSARRGSRIYLDCKEPHSATTLFDGNRERFPFLHGNYFQIFPLADPGYTSWLVNNLHLANYPRLVTLSAASALTLSKDFQFLLDTRSSQDVLLVLRNNWEHYSSWFGTPANLTRNAPRSGLTESLSKMEVACCGGRKAPLEETILPLKNMGLESLPSLSFLDVPEPEDVRWKYLLHFGVIVEYGPGPFIQCLRQLKTSGASVQQVSDLYRHIQGYYVFHGDAIRNAFRTEKLVYVPITTPGGPERGTWTDLSICVWDGPKILRKTPALRDSYPELKKFFYNTLGVMDANLKTLVDEAQNIDSHDRLDYISQLFITIARYMKKEEDDAIVSPSNDEIAQTLVGAPIFPILLKDSTATFDKLGTANHNELWFIADRWHLRQSFEGLIPLLAFNVKTIEKIPGFIKRLNLKNRLLSKVARGIPRIQGLSIPCENYTKSLRAKSRFIARILPQFLPKRKTVMAQLQNVEVYSVEKVVVEWAISVGESSVKIMGRSDSGRVKLTEEGRVLKIILRKTDADAARPPSMEFHEEMAKFCGISDSLHVAILHFILIEHDLNEIEDVLQRRGIPNDLPEFDNMEHDPVSGQALVFSGLNAKPIDLDGKDASQRYFGGRRKQQTHHQDSADAVRSFIDKFNLASSFQSRVAQTWQDAEARNMLSHICRLENIDPFLLLPQKNDIWTQRVRKAGGYPDDVVGVVFDESSPSSRRGCPSRSAQTFPAIVNVAGNGHIRVKVSTTVKNMPDEELQFAGELQVSKLLEKHMGNAYLPDTHWTSRLRRKAGLMPYEDRDNSQSTFTIDDISGSFTELLIRHGYKGANSWRRHVTYHIEVNTSETGLVSSFCLDPYQVEKAWNFNLGMRLNSTPDEVFVLIRICNVRTEPEVALLVDPWQMHIDGVLSLTSESQYEATFTEVPPVIRLGGSIEVDSPGKRGFGRILHRKNRSSQGSVDLKQVNPMYSYKPLGFGEIRLLELFPGSGEVPIQGTIRHTRLELAGQYSALSYVWGPALKPFDIQTADGKVLLTSALHSALKRIRSKDASIVLWADAVCINQADNHEKIVQIRLLRNIFQDAEVVLAWIGDEKDNSYRALEALVQIRTLAVTPDEWPMALPPISSTWSRGTPSPKETVWTDIGNLFQRDWFQRVWVVQELVLASQVRIICGTWDVNWDDIFAALETCLRNIQSLRPPDSRLRQVVAHAKPAYSLGLTRRMFKDPRLSRKFNLLSLFNMFSHADATKERDKLFGFLGLASDAGDEVFDPNYSSSLEVVIRRYAGEFVRRGNAMDLLYRAGTSTAYDFCSWIPKWTGRESFRTISTWRAAEGPFSAGGNFEANVQLPIMKAEKLQVNGFEIDTIVELCPSTTSHQDIISVVNIIHESIDKLKWYPTGESLNDLKLKVPIGNAIAPFSDDIEALGMGVDGSDGVNNFNWKEEFQAISSVKEMVDFLKKSEDVRERGWKYWITAATFAKRLSNGRFCVTERGYLGFAPQDAQLGDSLCVLHGGAVPFLLRWMPTADMAYQLIGECYIHGIMYGEALAFGGISERSFSLS